MNVLHIDASIRTENSTSRELSQLFISKLQVHKDLVVDRLDLAENTPAHISNLYTEAMYTPENEQSGEIKQSLEYSN